MWREFPSRPLRCGRASSQHIGSDVAKSGRGDRFSPFAATCRLWLGEGYGKGTSRLLDGQTLSGVRIAVGYIAVVICGGDHSFRHGAVGPCRRMVRPDGFRRMLYRGHCGNRVVFIKGFRRVPPARAFGRGHAVHRGGYGAYCFGRGGRRLSRFRRSPHRQRGSSRRRCGGFPGALRMRACAGFFPRETFRRPSAFGARGVGCGDAGHLGAVVSLRAMARAGCHGDFPDRVACPLSPPVWSFGRRGASTAEGACEDRDAVLYSHHPWIFRRGSRLHLGRALLNARRELAPLLVPRVSCSRSLPARGGAKTPARIRIVAGCCPARSDAGHVFRVPRSSASFAAVSPRSGLSHVCCMGCPNPHTNHRARADARTASRERSERYCIGKLSSGSGSCPFLPDRRDRRWRIERQRHRPFGDHGLGVPLPRMLRSAHACRPFRRSRFGDTRTFESRGSHRALEPPLR